MTTSPAENPKVMEEAAWWLHRLKHSPTPEVQAEFVSWIKKASVHLEEFLFAQAIWRELDGIDPAIRARYEGVAEPHSVVAFPASRTVSIAAAPYAAQRQPSRLRVGLRSKAGIAAAFALVACAAVLWALHPFRADVYATAIGEQRTIKLSDGSVMHLNTRTHAQVRYNAGAREVHLGEGEALFTVEPDVSRPFIVVTDGARVRALGTQFNVYRRREGDTQVSVVDGAVQVTAPAADVGIRLARGDEAQVIQGRIVRTKTPDVKQATAWRARELVFSGQPVAQIAAEFNRYNETQMRVEGQALRQHRMSGVFAADDPTPLVRFLSREPGVTVVQEGNEIVIRGR